MKTVHTALLEGARAFERIAIPDTVIDGAAALDQYDPAHQARWAQRTWDSLESLARYAAAAHRPERRFHGSFYTFCTCSPEASIPARTVKMGESKALRTTPRLMELRYFPIDPAVCGKPLALMEAHIAIQLVGNPAPRLYFLDDVRGATGKIHIGYVGRHLENKKTSRSM